MLNFSINQLSSEIQGALLADFPEDQFLPEETRSVVLGLISCIRWTAVRQFSFLRQNQEQVTLETIHTTNIFTSEWMSKDEVLARIEATTGFDSATATVAFEFLISRISLAIRSNDSIHLEGAGNISRQEDGAFLIELDEMMRLRSGNSLFANKGKTAGFSAS